VWGCTDELTTQATLDTRAAIVSIWLGWRRTIPFRNLRNLRDVPQNKLSCEKSAVRIGFLLEKRGSIVDIRRSESAREKRARSSLENRKWLYPAMLVIRNKVLEP
jgi:hypothetical protein